MTGQVSTARKDDRKVIFPLDKFDITEFICDPSHTGKRAIYELYAVSNHQGTPDVGHYWSYAKDADDNWRKFDDDRVEDINVNINPIVTKDAYTLFYRLKKFKIENNKELND